jgi:hypothetical protein
MDGVGALPAWAVWVVCRHLRRGPDLHTGQETSVQKVSDCFCGRDGFRKM